MNTTPNTTETGLLETPFQDIALAFSGGGFRAGTFALGVLSYLKQAKLKADGNDSLLDHVSYLSSASGGTIATAMFSLYASEGKSFEEFYRALFEQTEGTRIVSEALRILNDPTEWKKRPHKSRNLINAFALAYDRFLFHGASVNILNNNQETANSNLDEVCFNATELYNGLLFRQTIQMKKGEWKEPVLYGNFNLSLHHETAKHLLLSDLLAASSCFPGGFEPIVFPHDFANATINPPALLEGLDIELQELDWEELLLLYPKEAIDKVLQHIPRPIDLELLKLELEKLKYNESLKISLMDGGITDNQGVESMIQANERRIRNGRTPFDLMLVCDVSSHFMSAYQAPAEGKTSFWSINRVRITSLIAALCGITGLTFIWLYAPSTLFWNIIQCLTAVIVSGTAILFFLTEKVKNIITGQVHGDSGFDLTTIFSSKILRMLFKHFGNLRFNLLKNMLITRLTTLIVLSNDVFLNRIRYLLYNQFFNIQNMKATGRTKANHIYDLSFSNDLNRAGSSTRFNKKNNKRYKPSFEMQKIAENAFSMGTTLWFTEINDKEHRKASIIATGQFTTCYNLLDYIEQLKTSFDGRPPVFDNFSAENKALTEQLQQSLEADLERFREDPFWLYNQLGIRCKISNFQAVKASEVPFPETEFKGLR
jgi:hypothetical protein